MSVRAPAIVPIVEQYRVPLNPQRNQRQVAARHFANGKGERNLLPHPQRVFLNHLGPQRHLVHAGNFLVRQMQACSTVLPVRIMIREGNLLQVTNLVDRLIRAISKITHEFLRLGDLTLTSMKMTSAIHPSDNQSPTARFHSFRLPRQPTL